MGKLRPALDFFRHAPFRHWPRLTIYFIAWALFRFFRIRLFRQTELRFDNLLLSADVEGLSGLAFLHEILVKRVYDFGPSREDRGVRVIFDVGANAGFFALSRCAENPPLRAYCFEPHPDTFAKLERNIVLNSMQDRIVPVRAAVAASSGRCVLELSSDSSMAVVAGTTSGAAGLNVEVEAVSLDDFAIRANDHPDLLKIDVEGFEVEVLEGASTCLKSARHIILEYHSDALRERCLAILDSTGFKSTIRGGLIFASRSALRQTADSMSAHAGR